MLGRRRRAGNSGSGSDRLMVSGRDQGGSMSTDEPTYGSYLRIPELLALQRPRSRPPHPEELHFIVVHQALELWMKLLLHDLGRIVGLLDAGDFPRAQALLGRVNHTLGHALDQMRSLHTLAPWDLHQFRSYLGTASGSQSVQFRELELRSGLRDPAYLKALEIEGGGELPEPGGPPAWGGGPWRSHPPTPPPAWVSPTPPRGPTSTWTRGRGPT